ncbi:MAG: hypothetical protein AB1938_30750 [Myxococcota bacterium]
MGNMALKLLGGVLCVLVTGAARAEEPLLEEARSICAQRLDESADDTIAVATTTGTLSELGRTHFLFKFVGLNHADSCSVAMRSDGVEIDPEEEIQSELELRQAKYGALSPDTHARLSSLPPDGLVDVVLWIARPAHTPDFREASNPWDAKQEFVSSIVAPVINRLLSEFPYCEATAVPSSFSATARLKASDVLQVAVWQELESVEQAAAMELLQTSTPVWHGTHRLHLVQGPLSGASSKLGVVEDGQWVS